MDKTLEEIKTNEAFMIWLINKFSEKCAKNLILKGGMVLRLLECPRYTNDLDYVAIPFSSKKEVVSLIDKALSGFEKITYTYQLSSKAARFFVNLTNHHGKLSTQIELNVADSCETNVISTGEIAITHHLQPHLVSVMKYEIALAHKLGAWNERGLIRDLYDIYFITKNLEIQPDINVLRERLQKTKYAKSVQNGQKKPSNMTITQFVEKFKRALIELYEEKITVELRDYLPVDHNAGLDKKMKVVLTRMLENLVQWA